jgi:hypothetical protein
MLASESSCGALADAAGQGVTALEWRDESSLSSEVAPLAPVESRLV